MSQVIIYNQDNGIPAVVIPTPECLKSHGIMAIAIKDVPAGKPFKIVDADQLPQDVPQEAWRVDDAMLTDGVGGESNEFPDPVEPSDAAADFGQFLEAGGLNDTPFEGEQL